MSLLNPNFFIHAGNVLLLVAYTVRDILWLRLFALASSLIAMPYFALQPKPLWEPLGWTILFAVINVYQSWRIFVERRPVKLTPEEEEIHKRVFRELPPRKFLQVLSIGTRATSETGARLLERGKRAQAISLILRGKVRVTRDERVLGELKAGDIVGSALILSGISADVDAVATEEVRSLRWEVDPLDQFLAGNPETRIALQKYLARDLAGKLNRAVANLNQ
jgi:hypothetical protein